MLGSRGHGKVPRTIWGYSNGLLTENTPSRALAWQLHLQRWPGKFLDRNSVKGIEHSSFRQHLLLHIPTSTTPTYPSIPLLCDLTADTNYPTCSL